MIRITTEPFSIDKEIEKVKATSKNIGGISAFIGVVRGFANNGEKIQGLSFEYYEEMAYKNFEKIKDEALKKFEIGHISIVHRVGDIKTGDNIVLVIAAAKHRKDTFAACKYCIDELKKIVPIWKEDLK